MPRRSHRFVAFLVFSLCACAALTGCGIVGGASATNTPTATATPTITPTPTYTPTITPTPTPTDTPTPIPTPTPPPPDAELSQGRTAVLHVAGGGASGASAVFLGRTYQMVPDDTGFWIPIGAGATVEPGDHDVVVTLTDAAGAVLQTEHLLVQVDPTTFPTENIDIAVGGPNGLQPASEEQKELDIRAALFAVESPVKLWSGPFIVPVPGPITTEFGTARSYNNGPIGEHHSGTDIGADEGTPVVAAATGRVVFAGLLVERGLSVIIDHGLGVFTAYHHLSSYNVAEGQDVQQGEVIGAVGMTGLATGPHLHWELVVGGQNVDPEYWTYQGVAP